MSCPYLDILAVVSDCPIDAYCTLPRWVQRPGRVLSMTALRRWGMWALGGTQAQQGQSRGSWAMAMVILVPAQDLDTTGVLGTQGPTHL